MIPHFLKKLVLDEISLVDKGANPGARVVLAKRADASQDSTKDSVEKKGAKISAARMMKIKDMMKMLTDLMYEQEGEGPAPKEDMTMMEKLDVNKMAPEIQAHLAEVEKRGSEEVAKIQAEATEKIAKAEAATIEALAVAKSEREARIAKEYHEKVSLFKRLPLDVSKDGNVLREIDERCSPEVATRLMEILKAADAAMVESGILMTEIGSIHDEGASASDQLAAVAKRLLSEGKVETYAKGYVQAMAQHSDLAVRAQHEGRSN